MQKAQQTLLRTMVRKNDSMAETLDLYADQFKQKNGKINNNQINGIRKSAHSFRKHSTREEKVVKQFEDATRQILTKVEKCLKKNRIEADNSVF